LSYRQVIDENQYDLLVETEVYGRTANPVGFREMPRFDSAERPASRFLARRVLVEAGRCGIMAVECSRRSRTDLHMGNPCSKVFMFGQRGWGFSMVGRHPNRRS
jgi:hypothetical protein